MVLVLFCSAAVAESKVTDDELAGWLTAGRAALEDGLPSVAEKQLRSYLAAAEKRKERPAENEEAGVAEDAPDLFAEALRLYNDATAALKARSLESNALAKGSQRGPELLHAAEFRVAEQLAATEVESIIPVILLHTEIYQTYRSRRLLSLRYHARAMVESLARLYAQQGGSQGSRIVAARALASLAGHQQEANLPASSRRLFQTALELDPQSKAAMLGLAASYEKFGEYRQACDYLEQLVAAYPNLGEGLLRLAMNLKRIGNQQRARELVATIIEMNAPAWVRSLAFQEQARDLLESAELAQAIEVMERSIEEIGPHQGSVLLLAHLYDRTRRPYESLELLGRVRPGHAGFRGPNAAQRESARKVYDSWPRQALNSSLCHWVKPAILSCKKDWYAT